MLVLNKPLEVLYLDDDMIVMIAEDSDDDDDTRSQFVIIDG